MLLPLAIKEEPVKQSVNLSNRVLYINLCLALLCPWACHVLEIHVICHLLTEPQLHSGSQGSWVGWLLGLVELKPWDSVLAANVMPGL